MKGINQQLLQCFNEGHDQAFSEVYKLYYLQIFLYTGNFVRDKDDRKEIVSATFIALFQSVLKGKHFESRNHIRDFLHLVARNNAINQLRSAQRQMNRKNAFMQFALQQQNDIVDLTSDAEILPLIYAAMESLPAECKRIFKMYFLYGRSSRQIADALGLSVSTVRNQKSRAILLLRKQLRSAPAKN
jgi:RNA polymerase sigma-70 factor (ECF subfamily)